MLDKIFNGKKWEELKKQPRRVPDNRESMRDGGDGWVVTRQFDRPSTISKKEDPFDRHYFAAENAYDNEWRIRKYSYKLDQQDELEQTLVTYVAKPDQIVSLLRAYEQDLEKEGYVLVDGSKQNYGDFAIGNSLYFDTSGKIFKVSPEKPILSETVMPVATINKVLRPAAGEPVFESWDDVYDFLQRKIPETEDATIDNLKRDRKYDSLCKNSKETIEIITGHLKVLNGYPDDAYKFVNDINARCTSPVVSFTAGDFTDLARYLLRSTHVVALMRTVSVLSDGMLKRGMQNLRQDLYTLKIATEGLKKALVNGYGLSEKQAKKVIDIATGQQDTRPGTWPIEKMLDGYAPATGERKPKRIIRNWNDVHTRIQLDGILGRILSDGSLESLSKDAAYPQLVAACDKLCARADQFLNMSGQSSSGAAPLNVEIDFDFSKLATPENVTTARQVVMANIMTVLLRVGSEYGGQLPENSPMLDNIRTIGTQTLSIKPERVEEMLQVMRSGRDDSKKPWPIIWIKSYYPPPAPVAPPPPPKKSGGWMDIFS